jgi:hypothetical protein
MADDPLLELLPDEPLSQPVIRILPTAMASAHSPVFMSNVAGITCFSFSISVTSDLKSDEEEELNALANSVATRAASQAKIQAACL